VSRDPVVIVPGDVDVPDRLLGSLTFGAAGWLAVGVAGAALGAARWPAPLPVALGVLLVVLGSVGAFWRPGGRPLGAWILPAVAYLFRASRARRLAAADRTATEERSAAREDKRSRRPSTAARAFLVVAGLVVAGVLGGRLFAAVLPSGGAAGGTAAGRLDGGVTGLPALPAVPRLAAGGGHGCG
jgi:hypothetical protein